MGYNVTGLSCMPSLAVSAINVMGLPPQYMQVIRGLLVLVAVLLDSLKVAIYRRYL